MCLQMRLFLTASAKDQRIATFQAHHVFSSQGFLHHQLFNESLRRGLAAAAFAHMNNASRGGRVGQHLGVHQIVHQDHGGSLQGLDGFEGEQVGVTRTCTDQGDHGLG